MFHNRKALIPRREVAFSAGNLLIISKVGLLTILTILTILMFLVSSTSCINVLVIFFTWTCTLVNDSYNIGFQWGCLWVAFNVKPLKTMPSGGHEPLVYELSWSVSLLVSLIKDCCKLCELIQAHFSCGRPSSCKCFIFAISMSDIDFHNIIFSLIFRECSMLGNVHGLDVNYCQ